jgi:hypothetical protein
VHLAAIAMEAKEKASAFQRMLFRTKTTPPLTRRGL